MKKVIVLAAMLLALAMGIFAGFAVIRPDTRPAEESEEFRNILQYIGDITAEPHIAGSPENYKVRDMILNHALTLGLPSETIPFELDVVDFVADYEEGYENGSELYRQRVDDYMSQGGYDSLEEYARGRLNAGSADVLTLHNLLIKISGTAPAGAAMFVSHYDHVAGAPGAADDALAVACMMQLMEEMANQPPENDVYFLFTDGEEQGLLGAADFVRTQPAYAEDIDVLFNFEARGNRGAMLMFETSGRDYDLVREFKNCVPQPVTMSIATAIYSMMPNGTDYSEFKNAGYYGLNFAMIEGDETYHQPTDTLENLNKDTAWQYYQTMMALGEHFGSADLRAIENTQEALYFPLPFIGIVVMPGWLGYLFGFLPLVLAIILIVSSVRRKELKRSRQTMRIAGLLMLGVVPAAVTLFFFSGCYMLWVPSLLFLLADFIMEFAGEKGAWAGVFMLLVAVFVSTYLYVPLVFLVQVALKLWYATAVLAILPLVPAVAYGVKGVCRVNQ